MFAKNKPTPDLEFFTVFDSKTKSYSEPFPTQNKDVVLRDFSNAFRSPDAPTKNKYFINAEDYSIFKIGSFNLKTGTLETQNLEHIVNLHDIRAMSQPTTGPGAL